MAQPRFLLPLPKPDMKFSLIRLSPRQSARRIPRSHPCWRRAQAPAPGSQVNEFEGE